MNAIPRSLHAAAMLLAGVLLTCGARAADAAPPATAATPERSIRLYMEPALSFPIGTLADTAGVGVGGLVAVDYSLSESLSLVGHAGYIAGTDSSNTLGPLTVTSSLSVAPVVAGVRYYLLGAAPIRFYAMGEAGLTVVRTSITTQGQVAGASLNQSGDDTAVHMGTVFSVGAELDALDLRAGLMTMDLEHAQRATALVTSLAFRFASL